MEDNTNGGANPTRLDRIEKIIEVLANTQADLQQDVKILVRAQVVMSDDIERLKRRTEEKFQELAAAQKHTDQRMDALIITVDEIVRGRKQ